MKGQKILHSSARHDWRTPRALFDHFSRLVGGFHVDAAADPGSALCPVFIGPGSPFAGDALSVDWYELARVAGGLRRGERLRAWLNPPYGAELFPFLTAAVGAVEEHRELEVLALVPARVDAAWFNLAITRAISVHFLTGRVRFELENGRVGVRGESAPFPSAVIRLSSMGKGSPVVHWGYQWRPPKPPKPSKVAKVRTSKRKA